MIRSVASVEMPGWAGGVDGKFSFDARGSGFEPCYISTNITSFPRCHENLHDAMHHWPWIYSRIEDGLANTRWES